MEYRDFVVRIDRDGKGYRARVLASPAGEGWAPFVPPFDRELLSGLRESLQAAIRPAAVKSSGGEPDGLAIEQAKQVGAELYRALLGGRVKELFDRSLSASPTNGLRLKLRFDLTDADSAWLAELPWELLRDPEKPTSLALNPSTPVVRYLEMEGSRALEQFAPPLRVLAAAANPIGTRPLDLEAEQRRLAEVSGDGSQVKVDFLPKATLGALVERLQGERFHALHFMGHGGFEARSRRAALLFETARGLAEAVTGNALANDLQGQSWLQLVVLNACHSGDHRATESNDPFIGVATTLVQSGLPAVVAMRDSISNRGATAFGKSLYYSLVQGDPIDTAVTQARRSISPNATTSLEWSVPMLFLRSGDGRLFAAPDRPPIEPPEPLRSTAPEPDRLNVSIGSINHASQVVFGKNFNQK